MTQTSSEKLEATTGAERSERGGGIEPACEDVRHAAARSPGHGGPALRWWSAVGIGTVASLPLAWLLSYAGTLPFFLGLFFFILFGLLLGAVMHRTAAPCRPYNTHSVLIGTTAVVLICWSLSIVNESRDFPNDTALSVGEQVRDIGDRSIEDFRAMVADDIRRFFREVYPPGGAIGYVRWVLLSGEIKPGEVAGLTRKQEPRQRGLAWAVRAVLSIMLLAFGVGSQTFALRRLVDSSPRVIDTRGIAEPG